MSSNRWDEIEFTKVPSICLMKNWKTFLNEMIKKPPASLAEEETGNRHPEDSVRNSCRKRLRNCLLEGKSKKLKGRQLLPHKIVNRIMNTHILSALEKDLFSGQLSDIHGNVLASIESIKDRKYEDSKVASSSGVNLGEVVYLVHVSGSMPDLPMEVAIALGIFVSEFCSPAFVNRCLSFSATPAWLPMDATMTLSEKLNLF